MAIYLKKAAGIEESDVADAKVREIVERILRCQDAWPENLE